MDISAPHFEKKESTKHVAECADDIKQWLIQNLLSKTERAVFGDTPPADCTAVRNPGKSLTAVLHLTNGVTMLSRWAFVPCGC